MVGNGFYRIKKAFPPLRIEQNLYFVQSHGCFESPPPGWPFAHATVRATPRHCVPGCACAAPLQRVWGGVAARAWLRALRPTKSTLLCNYRRQMTPIRAAGGAIPRTLLSGRRAACSTAWRVHFKRDNPP